MMRRFSCEFVSPFNKINLPGNIDFYYTPISPPSRTVLLVAKAIGIELVLKDVDLLKGEHLTPEFLKVHVNSVIFVRDN